MKRNYEVSINAGYTFEQAQSMANAFQEYLLRKPGHEDRASNYLLAAGYDKAQTQKPILGHSRGHRHCKRDGGEIKVIRFQGNPSGH